MLLHDRAFFESYFKNWITDNFDYYFRHQARFFLDQNPGGTKQQTAIDPLPFMVDEVDYNTLEKGLGQWCEVLNLTYHDLYGDQRLVETSVLSHKELWTDLGFEHYLHKLLPPDYQAISLVRFDLEQRESGEWMIVNFDADHMQGLGLALENRVVHSKSIGYNLDLGHVMRLAPFFQSLKNTLFSSSRTHKEEPAIMIWTSGPEFEHYHEHVYLSRYFGYQLVESRDLTVRGGRVYLKTLAGLKPVDVLVRMTVGDELDPLHSPSKRGVAGLVQAMRDGVVFVTNAPGARLLSSEIICKNFAKIATCLLGEVPSLALKTIPFELSQTSFAVDYNWVDQPFGLRVFMGYFEGAWKLMPGGIVSQRQDKDWFKSAESVTKDFWVLSKQRVDQLSLLPLGEKPSEINRETDLPARVADDLFWLGRYIERASVDLRMFERCQGPLTQKSLGQLKQSLYSIQSISKKVLDRMSVETHRILSDLKLLLESNFDEEINLDTQSISLRLSAFSGLTTESMTRSSGWLFLDIGRRLERALLVAEGFKAYFRGEFLDSPLYTLLDVFDSTMTYRSRYKLSPQTSPVFDLLIIDESNPRSIAFQIEILDRHVKDLPRENAKSHISLEQKKIIEVFTQIRLCDSATIDNASALSFLHDLELKLMSFSDTLHNTYFSQIDAVQSLQARGSIGA